MRGKHDIIAPQEQHHFSAQAEKHHSPTATSFFDFAEALYEKDFISKLEIALKEASETGYWLELLYRTGFLDEATYTAMNRQCATIRVMLIASCKTAKEKYQQEK